MSIDVEERLRIFFASAPQNVHRVQTLEIGHSAMSRFYYLWREPQNGIITIDGVEAQIQAMNFEVQIAGTEAHLDQVFEIPLDTTDVENEFRSELARIPLDTTEKVHIVYREYLSDDLTDVLSRSVLQVESIVYALGSAKITAASPRLNVTSTGERYTPRDIPMLRSWL